MRRQDTPSTPADERRVAPQSFNRNGDPGQLCPLLCHVRRQDHPDLDTVAACPGLKLSFTETIAFGWGVASVRGGMGVVYEAYDHARGESVALKMLTNFDHESVARLKREFRTLSDLAHPNLVTYHELISADEIWFFSMELIGGVDFTTYSTLSDPGSMTSSSINSAGFGSGASGMTGNRAWSKEEVEQRSEAPTIGLDNAPPLRITGLSATGQETKILIPADEMPDLTALSAQPVRVDELPTKKKNGHSASGKPPSPPSSSAESDSLGSADPISNDPISRPSGTPSTVINVPLADGSTIASEVRDLTSVPFDPSRTLAWWGLDRERPTPISSPERLRDSVRQLLTGIDVLHQAGVQHRDIKPSNVLVTDRGRVIILDFGLASSRNVEDYQDRGIHGTPAYMAPEQAHGEPSEASDLYAVGIMLFEALVGTVPFIGSVYEALSAKQLLDPPAPSSLVTNVPADLDALCVGLLKRNPHHRNRHPRSSRVARRGRPPRASST